MHDLHVRQGSVKFLVAGLGDLRAEQRDAFEPGHFLQMHQSHVAELRFFMPGLNEPKATRVIESRFSVRRISWLRDTVVELPRFRSVLAIRRITR